MKHNIQKSKDILYKSNPQKIQFGFALLTLCLLVVSAAAPGAGCGTC